MTEPHDLYRRHLVKLLSSTLLLPLAGGNRASAATATFAYPGLEPAFDAAIKGLDLVEDLRFGSAAKAGGSPVAVAVKTLDDLENLFNPLEGDFNASGRHVGGAGPSTINSEVQRYATTFNDQNHVLEADGLRLQAVLNGGHFDSYLRGNIATGLASGGFSAGAEGASLPTRLADIGLTAADLASIEVGTCVVGGGPSGISVVAAKDAAAGTVTFEAVSSGIKEGYKGNWHVTFTRFAFARVAADVANGMTSAVRFKTPVASPVAPGMFALGVKCAPGYQNNPMANDRARVVSVSPDRLSVTFDRPLGLGALSPNSADGVLFIPGLTSGQIWSKRAYGPQRPNQEVQALQVEFTMPAMPPFAGAAYTKKAIEAAMAGAPGTAWGYWPAVWLYTFNPNGLARSPGEPWVELDILEIFTNFQRGQSVWTGALHNQPYTRQRALKQAGTNRARNGGTWLPTVVNRETLTPDAMNLMLAEPLTSGTRHTVGVIWTRDKVLHYVDGVPVAESNWVAPAKYPHQLGINLACGSLAGNYAGALFFPQQDSQASSQFLKIHSIKSWELG
ncbi:hypothetical protein GJ697_16920 [Pseudoduganella sp. FT25W]|uniref:GH16 domain-containing protein n=1 Tax=Duganella alba TaxID=2666081 RepID=A0A6L5QI78_9BURK|nr:hypothetical protein [Duganella alba]MRX09523.1 hypothetical protein [Duganella alba]MRX18296.1 hypothetical protein [Duganella alba]